MRILVTGASGFVGGALVAHLRAQGYDVLGHGRQAHPACDVVSDFSRGGAIYDLLSEVTHVIHAAGRKGGLKVAPYLADNAALPTRLFARAAQAGVRHFIHISSATALLDPALAGQQGLDERTPVNTAVPWAYARSKALAEQALTVAAKDSTTRLSLVRPCLIWGGAAPFHTRLRQRQFRQIGPATHGHTTVHIDNLSSLIARLLAYDGPEQVFHPQDPDPRALHKFLSELSGALNLPPPPRLSLRPARYAAQGAGALRALSGDTLDFGLQGITALFSREFTTHDASTRAALEWQPPLSIAAGLQGLSGLSRL